jgi:hypothetical protein
MSTELALQPTAPTTAVAEFSAFGNISHFENAQRMAKALCSSSIVPQNYQGDTNLGSCVIALEISNRIGASVLAVMQNLYVVHGKPGWSSQFLISCVNASRKFTPLRYRMTGEKGKDSWGCIAWATDKTGEVLESPEVTIEMAKAEGWYAKNGSKWKTMPELMLRYRTATLFARLYAPELTMGIQTADEIQDVIEVESSVVAPKVKTPSFPEPPPLALNAPPVEKKTRAKKEAAPAPLPNDGDLAPATPAPEPVKERSFEDVVDAVNPSAMAVTKLSQAIEAAELTEEKVLAFCESKKLFVEGGGRMLESIRPDKIEKLIANLPQLAEQIRGM